MRFAYLIEPPFNFRNSDGSIAGCDVELARHVLSVVGETFEPVEAEFSQFLPGLASGRWQMTTGLFVTDERSRIAAFTRPIWALPDGLLVRASNSLGLTGYDSVAADKGCVLAVIRDQIQHRTALDLGVPGYRIAIFETYEEAAKAVQSGAATAYASVARAHAGYLALNPHAGLEVVGVPSVERQPAFGAFAFAKTSDDLRKKVDTVLAKFLGGDGHRGMMKKYGFTDAEIDLVAS